MGKDEIVRRMNFINDSVGKKVQEKASVKFVSKTVKAVEDKFEGLSRLFKTQTENQEKVAADINQELKSFETGLKKMRWEIDRKIELPEIKKIWKNLERFALYDDFKDLHNKVIPEIAKFE